MPDDVDVFDNTRAALPLAVLAALTSRPKHGYGLVEQLNRAGFPRLKGGTLYPLLRRLEQQGLVTSQWQHDSSGPGRKVFTVTETGARNLTTAIHAWHHMGQTLDYLSTDTGGTP